MWTLCDTVHLVAVWIIIWVLDGMFDAVLDCLEQYAGIASLLGYNTLQETLVNTSEALYQTQQLCEQERTYFCKKLFNVTLIVK